MNKIGRPTDYTEELADEICQAIATNGVGLATLCKQNPHWPPREIIYRWRRRHPEFGLKYMQAKTEQIDALVDDILEISDNNSRDTKITNEDKEICNSEWINRSRLRVDTRKWLASKLAPKIYGTKAIDIGLDASLLEKVIDKL